MIRNHVAMPNEEKLIHEAVHSRSEVGHKGVDGPTVKTLLGRRGYGPFVPWPDALRQNIPIRSRSTPQRECQPTRHRPPPRLNIQHIHMSNPLCPTDENRFTVGGRTCVTANRSNIVSNETPPGHSWPTAEGAEPRVNPRDLPNQRLVEKNARREKNDGARLM